MPPLEARAFGKGRGSRQAANDSENRLPGGAYNQKGVDHHRGKVADQPSYLAVVGCELRSERTSVDEGELGWTSMDPPQTVLKTAGLASTAVRQRPG